MKVVEEKKLISVRDMKDGEIAVIVESTVKRYEGKVVQRNGSYLIALGSADYWDNPDTVSFKVSILPSGTKLEI